MAKSSGSTSNKLLYVLIIVVLALLAAAIVNFFFVTQRASHDEEFLGYAAEQAVLSQSVAKNAQLAITGDREAIQRLYTDRERFDRTLRLMRQGNPETLMPQPPRTVRQELSLLQENWSTARDAAQVLLDNGDLIRRANQSLSVIEENMPSLQSEIEALGDRMLDINAGASQVFYQGRLAQLAPRIQQWSSSLVSGTGQPADAARRLGNDNAFFGRVLAGFQDGDDDLDIQRINDNLTRDIINDIAFYYGRVNDEVRSIEGQRADLVLIHSANNTLAELSDRLLSGVRSAENNYRRSIDDRMFSATYGYIFGGAALLILAVLIYVYVLTSDTRKAAALQLEQNERNQEAILRLLDELGSLADGDLTVQVSVTEDITGAIADSINYAVDALRDLVVTINDTAVRVDATAQQTRATASHLAEASEHQSSEITSASRQIQEMAESIEQVSENAERSTRVAQQSVEIAHKGGDAVRRTIDGMNNIRENIQETSKRIKRLGESSQEIGDIVELINDIAEQTNILALNAAIQASAAGEAGRGFAVVADEVQRLAERSGNATRQIEALVKTIQTDTNEAVISMEHSTSGVVNGAQLAENAGEALDEIEKVSNHIATLIQSISSAARQQAQAATDVSRTMQVIQEITSQTHEGTTATADNIGKLAALATELRKSVSGFKLPGKQEEQTVVMSSDDFGGEVSGLEDYSDAGLGEESADLDDGGEELPELSDAVQDDTDESTEFVDEIEWPEDETEGEDDKDPRRTEKVD
ncbi:methyl-accepting chemotaxis protein [Natronospira bacteriovora]|uniref:Methyl-accepting chemotaxis protein n=1 Tax=Natronospira bacteriovora TaxID=3069753 RepID=A0ABU0W9C3_9GAMM|nr:methyl-accepting chemotaxis protein [Natronospira sp. AB-CW4]MDQ2070596.1 methyl-accepting chemotaxis protein [Natronospira sp. AB-CW4]